MDSENLVSLSLWIGVDKLPWWPWHTYLFQATASALPAVRTGKGNLNLAGVLFNYRCRLHQKNEHYSISIPWLKMVVSLVYYR